MSRIHEALNQAGVKTPAVQEARTPVDTALKDFPVGKDFPAGPEPEPEVTLDRRVSESRIPPKLATASLVERLVVHPRAEHMAVEQYRRIAAVLHQAQVDRGIRVVMVASAQAAEGKTLTTANLGLTLSESYKRKVLIIDADLRKPSMSNLFQLPKGPGLSENLRSPREQPLHLTTISDSLSLLPGGRPDADPMAGLTSGRMQQIIEQAAESFEWVILDTPPVALLSDARLLADMVDAAVLVISAGHTPHAMVERAIESIGRDKLVGVVLNRVDRNALKETSYYKYYRTGPGGHWPAAESREVTL